MLVRRGDVGAVRVAPDGDLGPRRGGPLRERPGARRLGQCGEVVDLGVGVLEDPPDLPGVPVGAERGLGPRGLQVLRLVLGGVVEVDAVRLELAAAVHGHLEEPGGQLLRTGGGTVLARHAEHGVVEGLQPVEHRRRAALVPSRVIGGRRARPGQGGRRRDETGEQQRGHRAEDASPAPGGPPARAALPRASCPACASDGEADTAGAENTEFPSGRGPRAWCACGECLASRLK